MRKFLKTYWINFIITIFAKPMNFVTLEDFWNDTAELLNELFKKFSSDFGKILRTTTQRVNFIRIWERIFKNN